MGKVGRSAGGLRTGNNVSLQNQRLAAVLRKLDGIATPLFESDFEMLSIHDTEYNIIKLSKRLENTLGKNVIGEKCYQVFHGNDADDVCPDCPAARLLATGRVEDSCEHTGKNGRNYSIRVFPLTDSQGNILAVLEHVTDITERKQAEDELKNITAFWETVFNSTHDTIAIINVADFTIAEVNDAFLRTYGLSREQVIGEACYWITHHCLEPCTGPDDVCPLMEVVSGGKHSIIEHIHRDSAGKEMYTEVSVSPIRDSKGDIIQVIHVSRDITERKRTEVRLRSAEEEYRMMIETSNEWIWMLDKQGNFTYFNKKAEKASGYNLDEWVGKSFSPLVTPEHLGRVQEVFNGVMSGKTMTYEIDVLKSNGSVVTLLVNTTPTRSDGKITGALSFGTDITGRKTTEEQLRKRDNELRLIRQMDKLKDEFIGMVSHELKTPLTVIIGALDVATKKGISPQERNELIENAAGSAEALADMVDNLLELSRHQSNRLSLQAKPTDIRPVIETIVRNLQNLSSSHRIVTDVPSGLPPALIDEIRINRILHNLIENAIKYSPEGGEIKVAVRQEPSQLIVSVRDSGMGISPEDQQRIFQSFERLDAWRKRDIAGVGLGLRVCQILVEAHGGRIWVESAPDKGSVFYFTLPAITSCCAGI